jgi:hypothetical protein
MGEERPADEGLLKAFHLMYDSFPECVQLADKSKRILAVNPAGQAIGRHVDTVCATMGAPEAHRGCLASKAVRERKTQWVFSDRTACGGNRSVTFWLPIEGYPDYFIHFACGYAIDYSGQTQEKPDHYSGQTQE